jgi:hypothetical protein
MPVVLRLGIGPEQSKRAPFVSAQVLIDAAVSMGRRNTQLKTTYREKQRLKPLARLGQPERCTGKVLIERDPTDWLLRGTLLESMLWMVLHRPFEPALLIGQFRALADV